MKAPRRQIEAEAKFLLSDPSKQVPALLKFLRKKEKLKIGDPSTHLQVDRYFDTREWDLYRAGWTYRFRDSPDNRSVYLKGLDSDCCQGVHRREEVELQVEKFPDSVPLISDAPLADELAECLDRMDVPLNELFRVHTERSTHRVSDGKTELLLCLDDTTLKAPGEDGASFSMHFFELEIELKSGKEKRLRKLATRIETELGLLPARMSKFERGIQAAGLAPEFEGKCADNIGPQTPFLELARFHLKTQFTAFLLNEKRAVEGLHPEGVHQMRVASRRMRVALEILGKLMFPGKYDRLLKDTKWITKVLGGVRDLDVFVDAVEQDAVSAGVRAKAVKKHLDNSRNSARKKLITSLSSDRYQRFKSAFSEFLEDAPLAVESVIGRELSAIEVAGEVLQPALAQLLEAGHCLNEDSPDAELHKLRLDGKHFRYQQELFSIVIPGGLSNYARASKKLQNTLGDHQDACVALTRFDEFEKLHKLAKADRRELHKLMELVEERRVALRKEFPAVWEFFCSNARPKFLRKLFSA